MGENAYTEQEKTKDPLLGAILGVQGISTPIIFGVLTTIVAFAAMFWVPGPMGKITCVIPVIV